MGPARIKGFARRLLTVAKAVTALPHLTELARQSGPLLQLAELTPSLIEHQNIIKQNSPTLSCLEDLLASMTIFGSNKSGTSSLDLGCGDRPRNPFGAEEFLGLDVREDLASNILCANLATQPIPCEGNRFDFCTAFDVIEHIPRVLPCDSGIRFPFIDLMNEIHRVLKPGGLFLHQTPAYPHKQAFQDPTHVNIITEDTFPYYFCEPNLYARKIGYGFTGSFELVRQDWLDTAWLVCVLKAVK
jgi:SAM-dependent methyltransferase